MINEPLYNSFPPGYEPNDAQEYILSEMDKALSKGKKFIIINAPTGTGKSFIAKTLANHSDFPTEDFSLLKAIGTFPLKTTFFLSSSSKKELG